ncbi:competence protein ComM [Gluconobacter morbifer G707]|uniref:Competence protein ComM n=1 Tax=Gluconobacter morbifer G707 TaxID=1088869 RepID=G6XIB2_9PROT|nr:competence protein ComM [Gluconobacter morbifer G707]
MTTPSQISSPASAPTLARIQSFAFSGIEAVPVTVEVQLSSGPPAFLVVGLADKSVGEARERVRAALTAMGLALPPKRILVNLVPADLVKEGAHFDLPIALGLLVAMGVLSFEAISAYAAVGELSLDGRINPVNGPVCRSGGECGEAGADLPAFAGSRSALG